MITIFSLPESQSQNFAGNFDGTNDYVSLPSELAVSQSANFTIEAWVYWTGTGKGCIYSESVSGNTTSMLSFGPDAAYSGGIGVTYRDNNGEGVYSASTGASLIANRWSHVAVVVTEGENLKIYVNGEKRHEAFFDAIQNWTPNQVNIGMLSEESQTDFFSGKIDELRIWNTARTQHQIKANLFNQTLANNASGMVAYYRFNEGSGLTVSNSCTNTPDSDGSLENGVSWADSPIEFSASALHFDMINDRVVANLSTTATTNVTLESWIYHTGNLGTDHVIMSHGRAGVDGFSFFLNTQRTLFILLGGVGSYNTGFVMPTNIWTHIALVISETGFTVYANGVNVYSNSALPISPTTTFAMGYNNNLNAQPFDGSIDEVRIWTTARSQSEIQSDMNKEIDPQTPGLVAYYTFNQGVTNGDNSGLVYLIDQTGTKNGILTNFGLSGTSSNYVTQHINLSILPLEWHSFTGTRLKENALLQWSTASEQNTKDFIIQHSTNGTNWKAVATVKAAGNSFITRWYQYIHNNAAAGINFYRIQQRDVDGRFGYSEIRNIKFENQEIQVRVLNSWISDGLLRLEINAPGSMPVSLYTLDGKLVWKQNLAAGTHQIDVSTYSKGIYILNAGRDAEKLRID